MLPFLSGPLLYFNSELSVGRTMFLICLKSIVKYDHDKSLEKENKKDVGNASPDLIFI